MQPITRATVDAFCRVCLQEYVEASADEYKLLPGITGIFERTDENRNKLLRMITADVDEELGRQQRGILPRRFCGACHVKACTFYEFHERARCSAIVLGEMMLEQLRESMIRNLQKFCRTCLRKLKSIDKSHVDEADVSEWLIKSVDVTVGKAEEEVNDQRNDYPKQLCNLCQKKLRNFIEFQRMAKESREYMEGLLGGLEEEEEPLELAPMLETNMEINEVVDCKDEIMEEVTTEPNIFIKEPTSPPNAEDLQKQTCDVFAEQLPVFDAKNTKQKFNRKTESKHNFEQDSDFNWEDTDSDNDDDSSDLNSEKAKKESNKDDDKNFVSPIDSDDDDVPIKVMAQRVAARRRIAKRKSCNEDEKEMTINNDTKTILLSDGDIKHEVDEPFSPKASKKRNQRSKKTNKNSEASDDKKSKEKKTLVCEQCDKKFYKQILYDAHVRGEHMGVEQPFQCEHCPKAYRAYPFLKRHIKDEHEGEKLEFKCEHCCRMFKRRDHLRAHIRGVHEGIRPYKCSYCEKSFGARKTVRVHEMTHTDARPFQCEHCPMAFRQATDLRIHLERHTTPAELLCPICKRAKGSVEELKAHIEEHDNKRYQCPTCGRVFKKRSHLSDHENAVHLGLRPHQCGYCERTFACRKSMLDHERLHTNERPKVCHICQMTFRQGSVLRAHIRRRHEREGGEQVKQRKRKDKVLLPSVPNMSDLLLLAQSNLIK